MNQPSRNHLFEVSWEVCNKVGGIYEVVASKAKHAVEEFNDEYLLLGPDTKHNTDFTETDEPFWDAIRFPIKEKNFRCRFGRWEIPGRPRVILVDFNGHYDSNQILRHLWERFGVDSLSGNWDYIEPVLFSYACGEIIATIHQILATRDKTHGIAQFHEWMCGAGILALKQLAPSMATVFTTHATVLGRSMAGSGVDIYSTMASISPARAAENYNVAAKCSMEKISAREADIFTTVSNITAEEARIFLGRTPDIITHNGLDLSTIHNFSADREAAKKNRERILAPVSKLLRRDIDPDTRILVISGRYEYHNKGVDLFLDALKEAKNNLKGSQSKILAIMLMMGGHTGVNKDAVDGNTDIHVNSDNPDYGFITSHNLYNVAYDPILNACDKLGLHNEPDDNVQIVFVPAMLDGKDGFFNLPYFDILSGCDLGIFPSWYEPWGYTPHECAAYSVPTVTTDLSGFGLWIREMEASIGSQPGIGVIARNKTEYAKTVSDLVDVIMFYATCTEEELDSRRTSVRAVSEYASWNKFFDLYKEAYDKVNQKAHSRRHATNENNALLKNTLALRPSPIPFLRKFNSVSELPEKISRLRDIVDNVWWSWHPLALDLFASMSPEEWEASGHNPVHMIEKLPQKRLQELANDKAFVRRLERLANNLDTYMAQDLLTVSNEDGSIIASRDNPIAYFSTEYGFHESLQLYSGGLGVLSGDHMKSASDERLPLIGVGLFYLNGYFQQSVDKNGHQNPQYPVNHPNNLPMEAVMDDKGLPLILSQPIGNRSLYFRIWKIQVGRIPLFLLDTHVPQNTDEDQRVTDRLYEADRDVRLRQEILLGMGGVRMLAALGITPSVWHMNEGHSAFLILERLRQHMVADDMTLEEAKPLVRSSCVFTTHTPVDAGNERFTVDQMKQYFQPLAKSLGLSWQDFLNMGCQDGGDPYNFDMTVLALRMSSQANAVSMMHGMVSRRMWRNLWKGFTEAELPITHVTNGVHTASYVGPAFKQLLNRYLGDDWLELPPEDSTWENVYSIPDSEFWNARKVQKQTLIDALLERLPKCTAYSDITGDERKKWLSGLTQDTLIIGFARRFAPYKRATMLFADPDRLAKLLNNPERPFVLVVAGKAHPADSAGVQLIEEVIRWSRDPRFYGKIFFIENYNLEVSRLLSRGCDVWLNNPRRPYEASGTSGEKVPVNGGINLSISDGWWVEGANGTNGWTIGPNADYSTLSSTQNDYEDADSLYQLLEDNVLPLYYYKNVDGIPHAWIKVAKNSLRTLTAMYGCRRMVRDYMNKIYVPAANRGFAMEKNHQKKARKITAWQQTIPGRFNTVSIKNIDVQGINGTEVYCDKPFTLTVELSPYDMTPEELCVQVVLGVTDGENFTEPPTIVTMNLAEEKEDGTLIYEANCSTAANGLHAYGIRVVPVIDPMDHIMHSGFVRWV